MYGFCKQNCDFWFRITSLYGSQTSPVDLWMRNSANSIRIINTQESKTSSLVFCMQNSDFRTRIKSLYWSQTIPVVCTYKTARLATELRVAMGSRPQLSFCACKTTRLASELILSMGPSPHLWFLHAKLRLLDQNYKSP